MFRHYTIVWLISLCVFNPLCSSGIEANNIPSDSTDAKIKIKGTPRIIHYTKNQFNADPQFWTMCEDEDGILYFGNNDGIIIFNGEVWQNVKLPNRSSVRSLFCSDDGIIYAAGFNEFGKVKKDQFGRYHYQSLTNRLRPEDRDFENIWRIHEVQGHIVFRSQQMIIALKNKKAVTLPATDNFGFSNVIDHQLYVLDKGGIKLLNLNTLDFTPFIDKEAYNDKEILTILPGTNDDELILFTKEGNAFKYSKARGQLTFWKSLIPDNANNLIISAIKSSDDYYYLGTLSNKIMVLDQAGKEVSTNKPYYDLQDNTVLNLYESRQGNIWALLNKGIDCIDISSPAKLIFENASIFDVLIHDNNMYLATNQGVFVHNELAKSESLSRSGFTKIRGLEGQAWSLQKFNNKILCGHDRGLFVISAKDEHQIPDLSGIWKVIAIEGKPDHYLVCTYEGFYLLQYNHTKQGFVLKHRIVGFNESGRDILQSDDQRTFWVCHGYKGVYRIKFDKQFKKVVGIEHYKDQNGLPSPYNVNVFRWKEETVFTTNSGIFTYNAANNQFQTHTFLTKRFGTQHNVRKLLQHGDKTWFVHDDEAGFFYTDATKPSLNKALFLQLKGTFNRSMECIAPIGSDQVLLGTYNGLYSFDLTEQTNQKEAKTKITTVNYMEGSEKHPVSIFSSPNETTQLPPQISNLRFHFAAPQLQEGKNIQYSYILEGADQQWSNWQETPYKEFNHLASGQYVFKVKAKSMLGQQSATAMYHFEVQPFWYKSAWAVAVYVLLVVSSLIIAVIFVKRKIQREKEKTRLEEEERRKLLELEIQQINLEREKEKIQRDKLELEEDVIYKSKELANYTMLLARKRELLIEMKEDLNELKASAKNDQSRNKIRQLTKRINANLNDEEHLKVFEANFERVHSNFFNALKTNYSDLTQKDLRLCALVKMNLTNKEIASILNISVRGVETARYRLRKRLDLSHEENMVDFFEKLGVE